ncbi:hypothetical protein Lal_00007163 [Lupinus albus]|nr:hypothetical protein Lal_00007163 [Lupinus albus]
MAKKNMLEREFKRKRLILKYLEKRNSDFLNISNVLKKFQKLPRNSSPTRLRNRCWKTGKPHGFFRHFGLCRNAFRELANNGMLPGVVKSSW